LVREGFFRLGEDGVASEGTGELRMRIGTRSNCFKMTDNECKKSEPQLNGHVKYTDRKQKDFIIGEKEIARDQLKECNSREHEKEEVQMSCFPLLFFGKFLIFI